MKRKAKETKGLSIKAPSYAQLQKDYEDLKRMLEKEKNEKKKEKASRKKKAAKKSRSSSSNSSSNTIKEYDDVDEDLLLASPPSKLVAKPKLATSGRVLWGPANSGSRHPEGRSSRYWKWVLWTWDSVSLRS